VPLPHRNRREFLNPAYLDETPAAQADRGVALADWVADLQVSVRRTRQRRRLLVATGSAAALMLTTVGIALATDQHGTDGAQISTPVTGGRGATAPEQGHPIQRETPPQRPGGLTVWARGTSDVVAAGQQFGVEISWRDGDGRLTGLGQDWGDGTGFSVPAATARCAGAGVASHGSTTVWHAWRSPGMYTVRLSATTGTCGARVERRFVGFTVRVVAPGQRVTVVPQPRSTPPSPGTTPAPPSSPSPPTSPTPSPSPSSPGPSPSPTPTETTSPTPEPEPTTTSPVPETTPPGPSPTDVSSSPVTPAATPTG
jgi:hypothetical protein